MKIPGPMIAVLLIIVLLFCCTSGLGLQGSLNVITFDSAQDLMSGDLFAFLRPRVGVNDIPATPTRVNSHDCLSIRTNGQNSQLSGISLTSAGQCEFLIAPADTDVRTLPLVISSGQARVSFEPAPLPTAAPNQPTPTEDETALKITNRLVDANNPTLNVSVSRSGGTLTVECQNACSLNIGD